MSFKSESRARPSYYSWNLHVPKGKIMARRFSLLISLTVMEIVAILVLYATPSSNYQPKIETLCVNAGDNPTECSALTQMFNCSACQPLSLYVQNVSKYLTSNVEMVFTKGSHCLPPPPQGFEIYFYKSMTQYDKAWIQFGFLFYLCILELAIIILSCKYIFFTRLFGRNVVKVLATLFFYSVVPKI